VTGCEFVSHGGADGGVGCHGSRPPSDSSRRVLTRTRAREPRLPSHATAESAETMMYPTVRQRFS
jgi:hypothetical protein